MDSGNRLALMNDPRGTMQEPNMEFVWFDYKGLPYLFAKASTDIAPNEELTASYSSAYWDEAGATDLRRQEDFIDIVDLIKRGLMTKIKGRSVANPIHLE